MSHVSNLPYVFLLVDPGLEHADTHHVRYGGLRYRGQASRNAADHPAPSHAGQGGRSRDHDVRDHGAHQAADDDGLAPYHVRHVARDRAACHRERPAARTREDEHDKENDITKMTTTSP